MTGARVSSGDGRRLVSDSTKDAVKTRWLVGMSAGKIAAEIGITKNAVVGLRKRMGLPGRPSPIGNGHKGEGRVVVKAAKPVLKAATLPPLPTPSLPPAAEPAALLRAQPLYVLRPALPLPVAPARCCQWPMWEGSGRAPRPPKFCDAAVADLGHPYCGKHCRVAYGSST